MGGKPAGDGSLPWAAGSVFTATGRAGGLQGTGRGRGSVQPLPLTPACLAPPCFALMQLPGRENPTTSLKGILCAKEGPGWPRVPHGADLSSLLTVSCVTRVGSGAGTPCRPGLPIGGEGQRRLAAPQPARRVPVPGGRRPAPSVHPQRPAVWPGSRGKGRAPWGRSCRPWVSQPGGGGGCWPPASPTAGAFLRVCGVHSFPPGPLMQPAARSHCLPRARGHAASPRSRVSRHAGSRTRP